MRRYLCAIAFLFLSTAALRGQGIELALQSTIALPGVQGKFDHFAMDDAGKRLFVAAAGNHSVEIIDLPTGKVIDSLKGLGKPHGLAWLPKSGSLFVADGTRAELAVYAGVPLRRIKAIPLSEDADDIVFDAAANLLYVGHGGTNAANPAQVAVVDAATLTVVQNLPVGSHPEALEIDAIHDRVFVNIADKGEIAVIDGKTHSITATWTLKHATGNTPLAYDAVDNVLLVGCRTPATLVALNADNGAELASVHTAEGADDLFYQPSSRQAYLIAGSGVINTFTLLPGGQLQLAGTTHTLAGAKTGLLSTAESLLYVGIPAAAQAAGIRVYQAAAR